MINLLTVHDKAVNKVYFLYIIIFSLNLISLIFMTIIYCINAYSFQYLEEDDPNIDLTGISKFTFDSGDIPEYNPGQPNLGNTGKLFFHCYTGKCTYSQSYSCTIQECTGEGENRECHDVESTCTTSTTRTEHGCSNECRLTKSSGCGSSYCRGYYGYYYSSSSCSYIDDPRTIDLPKSCNADNIIYNWRNYYYSRSNATTYGKHKYLDSAVPANETCPNGTKMCGILDNLGNKLCYNNSEICPINYVSLNKPNTNTSYDTVNVDGITIYYTNALNETRKVFGGFFVDSDLLIKYNNEDCETLATSTISSLLNSHSNKLYRESLDFDPYKEKDNINQRGKSYLKWCIPGHGKEKNISKIKELKVKYEFNVTQNKEFIGPIKTKFLLSYLISLPGYIRAFFYLIIFYFSFNAQNNISSRITCKYLIYENNKNIFIIIPLIISLILIFIGSIISLLNTIYLFKANKLDFETNIFISFIIMNIICFIINMLLILFIAWLLIYLFITPKNIFDYYKSKNNDNKDKDKKEIDMRNLADFKDNPDFNGEIEDFKNNPDFKGYNTPLVDDSSQETPTPTPA